MTYWWIYHEPEAYGPYPTKEAADANARDLFHTLAERKQQARKHAETQQDEVTRRVYLALDRGPIQIQISDIPPSPENHDIYRPGGWNPTPEELENDYRAFSKQIEGI